MAKVYQLDFLLGAKKKGSFGRVFDLAGKKIDSLGKKMAASQKISLQQQANMGRRRGFKTQLAGAAALGAGIFGLGKAYGSLADAQGEIASLDIGDAGIAKITAAAKSFSNQWSGTTAPEFITASYDIKSGISSLSDTAVGEFTRIAALTGKATKSSTGEMTTLFAKGYGIYRKQFDAFGATTVAGWQKMSAEERDIQFGKYFSGGIAASVKAFRTDGAQMSEALSTLGSDATQAGVSFAEQLSVLGNLQTVFSGSESATKFKSFLQGAFKAGDKLDLEFVDQDTGQLKSIPVILEMIKEKYNGVIGAAAKAELKEAFGRKEAVALIDNLIDKTDTLKNSTSGLNDTLKKGTTITLEMAKAMQRGPNAEFSLLWQRGLSLAASLGKTLAPTISLVSGGLGKMATFADDLVTRFPMAASVIGGVVGVTAALAIASIGLGYASTFVFGGLLNLKKAWLLVNNSMAFAKVQTVALRVVQLAGAAATKIMTAAQWAWNVALNANPIGLIVAGVAALGAAAYMVYKHWEPIKTFFVDTWNWFKNLSWFDVGSNLISTLAGGIWSGITAPFDAVKGVLGKVRDLLPFSDAKTGPLSQLTLAGKKTMETFGSGVKTARPSAPGAQGASGTTSLQSSNSSGSSMQIHYSPTIHLSPGADQNVRQEINRGLVESERRFREMLERVMGNEQRLSYG